VLCLLGLCFITVLFSCSVLHSHTAIANLPNEPQELHSNNNNNNSYYTSTANRKHVGDALNTHTHTYTHTSISGFLLTVMVRHKEEGVTAKSITFPKLYDKARAELIEKRENE